MIPKIMHFLGWPIDFLIFKIFTNFSVIGKENIKGIKTAVFVGNHESGFDPYIIGASLDWFSNLHPVYYLTQDKKFEKVLLRIVFSLFGAFRGKVGEGVEEALKRPLDLLEQNKSVGIFLEGCYKSEINKKRIPIVISSISIKSGKPIIPVFIFGIYDGGVSWRKIFNRQRDIKVIFGKPIYPINGTNEEEMADLIQKSFLHTKLMLIKFFHKEEKKFWSNYARFYHYLERADPYRQLVEDFDRNLPEIIEGKWIDLGSGSGEIVELLVKKNNNSQAEIVATDFDDKMFEHLTKRFNNQNMNVKKLDLAFSFDFPENSFDGVTANLVLPYIIHHEGEIGLKSFARLIENIHGILRPGGLFVCSSPKNKVNFFKVFLASWKNILNPRNIDNIFYGPAILQQALRIQNKGRRNIYHFLDTRELERMLSDIGFTDIKFTRSMAGQVNIISCKKPIN